ncbi:MAG TPA: aminotransferase class V-fold PLP-dependent enzyme [Candidatus Dormibacteraeota bacterium]|nr:aminotransferase class V-fold PLP-dependent enzyme [Candidatus Dormibacteraeota bacterium]
MDELRPPTRLMLTPGPSSISPRVYRALASPLVGHVDPWFTEFMGGVQDLMRRVFQTQNHTTYPISASGSGGIETAVVNVIEPGDEAIVCVNGIFSARMADVAECVGAKVHRVSAPFGRTVDPEDVRRAGKGRKIKFVGLAHGETSTGVVTRIEAFRTVADELGALLIVDSVATLAGVPLDVDRERIDICFSGSQKAISAPPGMSPITVNASTEKLIRARKTKVQSWYFDLTTVMNYWGNSRMYHHTPPISLIYAIHEAMRIVLEEGLEASWARHRQNQLALIAGLEAMGIGLFVQNPADRLPTVTAVTVPNGIDSVKVRARLLNDFNIEISGGLGDYKATMWRVGLMGYSSQRANVLLFLDVLERILLDEGMKLPVGAGIAAAAGSFAHAEPVAAGQGK